jgi:hypothetical protein
MPYGSVLTDTVQSSTAATAPVFKDGNGTQIGTLCRAWVNFAGASGAINASFNVSSVTRNSTGLYIVNYTTAMPDAKYSAQVNATATTNAFSSVLAALAAGSTTIQTANNLGTVVDPTVVTFASFR